MSRNTTGIITVTVLILSLVCGCFAQSKSTDRELKSSKDSVNEKCSSLRAKYDAMGDQLVQELTTTPVSSSGMATALDINVEVQQYRLQRAQVCLDTAELLLEARTEHEVDLLKLSMLKRFQSNMKAYRDMLQYYLEAKK